MFHAVFVIFTVVVVISRIFVISLIIFIFLRRESPTGEQIVHRLVAQINYNYLFLRDVKKITRFFIYAVVESVQKVRRNRAC